jgi:hypothetical protein
MAMEPDADWLIVDDLLPVVPHCLWIKITQLLGEVSCYLLPVHEGPHCSVDWMEWT